MSAYSKVRRLPFPMVIVNFLVSSLDLPVLAEGASTIGTSAVKSLRLSVTVSVKEKH